MPAVTIPAVTIPQRVSELGPAMVDYYHVDGETADATDEEDPIGEEADADPADREWHCPRLPRSHGS